MDESTYGKIVTLNTQVYQKDWTKEECDARDQADQELRKDLKEYLKMVEKEK